MDSKIKMVATVSQREQDICLRVRVIRLLLKWSQPDYAEALGITRVRLASYEYGRAPLRYEIGNRLCSHFGICQRWLAEGLPPRNYYVVLTDDFNAKIPVRALFSQVYDGILKKEFENAELKKQLDFCGEIEGIDAGKPLGLALTHEDQMRKMTAEITGAAFLRIPRKLHHHYFSLVCNVTQGFFEKHAREITEQSKQRKNHG